MCTDTDLNLFVPLKFSSATDGKDGDVTSRVVVTGWASRDTSVIGKQVLTYTVSDSDLNVAFAVRYVSHCLLTYIYVCFE